MCAGPGQVDLTKFSFVCPNGTLFNQQYFVCDWWFNVDCAKAESFYSLNTERETRAGVDGGRGSEGGAGGRGNEGKAGGRGRDGGAGRGSGLRRAEPGLSLQSLYSSGPEAEQVNLSTEYKRPSRDLQFDYVNLGNS